MFVGFSGEVTAFKKVINQLRRERVLKKILIYKSKQNCM